MTDFATPLPTAAQLQSLVGRISPAGRAEGGDANLSEAFSALLASQLQGGGEASAEGLLAMLLLRLTEQTVTAQPAAHINQFEAEKQIGGDGANADCGPTSLVMALGAIGLELPGSSYGMTSGDSVRLARRVMVSDPGRDGVGPNANAERNTFTNLGEVRRGALQAGARSQVLAPTSQSVREALSGGAAVVVSGTFAGKHPLPWTGDRGTDSGSPPGGATAHIVAVTGYDRYTNQFRVQDPARRTPLLVSPDALDAFMRGNAGALALFNPRRTGTQGLRIGY
jgi:hypothetical protein